MRGLLIGVGLGVALVVVAIVLLVVFWAGPELSVQASVPQEVSLREPFRIHLRLFNPHDEVVMLDSIDLDDSILESFQVTSVTPTPTDDSPTRIVGIHSWAFYLDLEPGAEQAVEFELVPSRTGTFQLPLDVCNAYQDCSRNLLAVRVTSDQSE